MSRRASLSLQDYVDGVRASDRVILGRALTLVESSRSQDHALSAELIAALKETAGNSHRVGITGVPGAGKSTLIEAMGCQLIEAGHRVAVLAVDPTSQLTGGSILGDKTRMQRLSGLKEAYIRPSPTSGVHGGVGRYTREAILICEAAGFDIVLVETVGVGQIEASVAEMVDTYVLLTLAGAGDELQGIKRGVMELADIVAVNKADGDGLPRAKQAARMTESALKLLHGSSGHWTPPVLTCSALHEEGVGALWETISAHRVTRQASGEWERKRTEQRLGWFKAALASELWRSLQANPRIGARLAELQTAIEEDEVTVPEAIQRVVTSIRTE